MLKDQDPKEEVDSPMVQEDAIGATNGEGDSDRSWCRHLVMGLVCKLQRVLQKSAGSVKSVGRTETQIFCPFMEQVANILDITMNHAMTEHVPEVERNNCLHRNTSRPRTTISRTRPLHYPGFSCIFPGSVITAVWGVYSPNCILTS